MSITITINYCMFYFSYYFFIKSSEYYHSKYLIVDMNYMVMFKKSINYYYRIIKYRVIQINMPFAICFLWLFITLLFHRFILIRFVFSCFFTCKYSFFYSIVFVKINSILLYCKTLLSFILLQVIFNNFSRTKASVVLTSNSMGIVIKYFVTSRSSNSSDAIRG